MRAPAVSSLSCRLRQPRFLLVALPALLTLLLFHRLLFAGEVLYFGDIGLYFAPLLHFQRGELLQGRVPLWNPTLLCGTPFVGDPQSWPLYPSSSLLWLLGAPRATGAIGALHVFWAAVGTAAFLRRRGRSVPGALLGAIAFAFGAAFVSKLQFPNMAQAAAWLPWLLWAAEGVLERPGTKSVALLGLCTGLALLAAHPQMFVMQFYLGLAWCLWRVVGRADRRVGSRVSEATRCAPAAGVSSGLAEGEGPGLSIVRQDTPAPQGRTASSFRYSLPLLGLLALGMMLGAVMAMGQLLPVVEMARESVRPHLTLREANRFILPPYALLYNFILPNFYGNPASETEFVARGNFWESVCYIGLLPFMLAIGAAVRLWRGVEEARFWAVAAVAGMWLAMGSDAGLFALAFRVLPGLKAFHDPARWLHPATFALACLASLGFDAVLATIGSPGRRRLLAVGVLILSAADVLAFSATLSPTVDGRVFDAPAATAQALELDRAPGRVWHADNDRVWRRYVNYRSYANVYGAEDARGFLATLGPNLSSYAGLRDASGYEPVRRADMDILLAAVRDGAEGQQRSRLLPVLGVSRVLSLPGPAGALPAARAVPGFRGRAQLWAGWQAADTQADALRSVTDPAWAGVPVVVGATAQANGRGNKTAPAAVLDVDDAGPDRVRVVLPAGHSAGVVVLADARHPGWSASVDGRAAPLLSADGALRAVPVEAAARSIIFRYDPASWRVGMFLSLLAMGTVSGMFVGAVLCRRSNHDSGSDGGVRPKGVRKRDG